MKLLPYELEVCVGCGGVLFHSMSIMACELNVRAPKRHRMVFVDGDKVEQRNMIRQAWRTGTERSKFRTHKAFIAANVWGPMAVGANIEVQTAFLKDGAHLVRLAVVESELPDTRLIVYSFVDTADGRRACRDGILAAVRDVVGISEGWLIMAGNDLESGQCGGYRCDKKGWAHPGGALENGEMQRQCAPQPEGRSRTDTHSCGAHVEQSMAGNMFTALCVQRVLEGLRTGADTIEVFWQRQVSVAKNSVQGVELWTQTRI